MSEPIDDPIPNRTKLVTVADMQAIEREADASGHSYASMMEIAGTAVADHIVAQVEGTDAFVLILVGPGNNGGDGLVCARHLHRQGLAVGVYLWKRSVEPDKDYEDHFARLVKLGVDSAAAAEDHEWTTLRAWLDEATVVVDGLLGTGANRPIEGELAALLTCVKQACDREHGPMVVAIDSPSGLNCDSGQADPFTIAADQTVTFAYAKQGHYIFPAPSVIGELFVVDIGTAPELADDVRTFLLTDEVASDWLPQRNVNSHKGTFGKVMLVVGSMNYPGAAYLSCAAAGRVGAGLVTGAIPDAIWMLTAAKFSEATWLPLPTGSGDAYGSIDQAAVSQVASALDSYSALVLGCGLGHHLTTQRFVEVLLANSNLPATVVDADGLNCLAHLPDWPQMLPPTTILTPHPAEMARLCGVSVSQIVE